MTRSIRIVLLGIGVLVVAFVAFVGWMLTTAWYAVPHYALSTAIELEAPVMTAEQYGEVFESHARPFVYEVESSGGGAVLIYGATHTRNSDDPQITDIESHWNTFDPTVALVESELGMLFPTFMDPVHTFGEIGVVHGLARKADVPTYTWEPTDAILVQSLRDQGFTAEQVALRLMLRAYFSNLRFGKPDDPESFVEEYRAERVQWAGLEDTFASMDELNAAWERHFPDGPDWRDVSDEYGLPGFLGEMDGNAARDEHFVRVVIDLVRRGERVFAICGSSHAVKLEPAIRATLK